MTLQQQIDSDLKKAMLARDNVAKLTLRAVKTAITEALKSGDAAIAPSQDGAVPDELVQKIIQRLAKQRRDAAAEYEKAAQAERAEEELAELRILEKYLPQQLTESEVTEIVRAAIAETGASSMRDMGQLMSAAMPKTEGRADGKVVNRIARTLLSA